MAEPKRKNTREQIIDWEAWRRRIEVDIRTLHYQKGLLDEQFKELAQKMLHAQQTLGKLAAEIKDANEA